MIKSGSQTRVNSGTCLPVEAFGEEQGKDRGIKPGKTGRPGLAQGYTGLILIALSALSLMAFLLWQGYQDAMRTAEHTSRGVLAIYESHLNASLGRADAALIEIGASARPRFAAGNASNDNWSGTTDALVRRLGQSAEIDGVYLIDANGRLRYSSDTSVSGLDLSDRDYFRKLHDAPLQGMVTSGLLVLRTTGQPSIMLARAVIGTEGDFLGVVGMTLNVGHFAEILDRVDLGPRGFLAISNAEDGQTILRRPLQKESPMVQIQSELLRGHLTNKPEGSFLATDPIDGVERLISFCRVRNYPWQVVAGVAKQEILADWWKRLYVTAAAMAILLLAGWLMSRRIIRSNRALEAGAARLAQLSLAVEQNPNAVIMTDLAGIITYVNPAFVEMSGYSPEEALGQKASMQKSGQSPPETYISLRQTLERGDVWSGEFINRRKNGRLRTDFARVSPIRNGSGEIFGYLSIQEDISERKALARELDLHRHHLSELVEVRTQQLADANKVLAALNAEVTELYNSAPCGYHTLSADGLIVRINDTELAWLNATRPEIEYRLRFVDLLAEECRPLLLDQLANLRQVETTLSLEVELLRADGQRVPVVLNMRAVFADDGSLAHVLATVFADAERRNRERRIRNLNASLMERAIDLERARDAAEAANRSKSAFLANMSHEIRTPMNAILGFTHALLRDTLQEQQRASLKKIGDAAQHLLSVINDILDISKIEAGKVILEPGDFRIDTVFERAITLVAGKAEEKGLQVRHSIAPQLLGEVRGDAMRLGQIMLNILGNAVKFTDNGQIKLSAGLQKREGERLLVRFSISDSGIGIDPAAQQRLFSPFEQADASTTRRYGGSGLGLAISRRLVEMMGGEIGLDSQPGQGSTFWFTAWFDAVADKPTAMMAVPATNESVEEILRRKYAGCSVLVAEDNPINQEVICFFLQEIGFNPICADNGRLALDIAGKTSCALILMDMLMPEMDGIEATRRLRSQPGFDNVPIIALTASAFDDDRQRCLAAGMDDHMGKPIDPKIFFPTLLRWLESGRTPVLSAIS